jgi:gp32 DNA binding protein like
LTVILPRSTTERSNAAIAAKTRSSSQSNPAVFPLWNGSIGSNQTLRFLPDLHNSDIQVIVKQQIKLPFVGIVNGGEKNTGNAVAVQVPCLRQWGLTCYITEATKHLWNSSEADKDIARIYYRTLTYWLSGFVVQTTIVEDKAPANPLRLFPVNKALYQNSILPVLSDVSYEYTPMDPVEGRDFIVRKSQSGSWASYASSSFNYKPRPLSDVELTAVEKFGLWDLQALLGPVPTDEQQAAIKAMFELSFAGEPFDAGQFPEWHAFNAERGNQPTTAAPAAAPISAAQRAASRANGNKTLAELKRGGPQVTTYATPSSPSAE